MPNIGTMSTASDMVALYLNAESRVLAGKAVTLAGRSVSMEDLAEIRAGRKEWERKLAEEQASAAGIKSTGFAVAAFSDE